MRNACDYAARFNSPYDYDNRHFDFAVIFTARNFGYSGMLIDQFVLYCIVLYCIVLYCIALYCIVLYCIVL